MWVPVAMTLKLCSLNFRPMPGDELVTLGVGTVGASVEKRGQKPRFHRRPPVLPKAASSQLRLENSRLTSGSVPEGTCTETCVPSHPPGCAMDCSCIKSFRDRTET